MPQLVRDGGRLRLALAAQGDRDEHRGFDFHMLPPILLGLMVPFVAATYFLPEALQHVKLPLWLFLVFMFFVCTGLFIYTIRYPGQITGIVVDRSARSVEIIWRSKLSMASQVVSFQQISALRTRKDYDADGYPKSTAELVLKPRSVIALPADTCEEHLRPLRAAIGLG